MAKRQSKKTLGEAMEEVTELEQKAAVQEVLANYLRGRYLSRDSVQALSRIDCNGAPVQEVVVEAMAIELEEGVEEMRRVAARAKEEVFSG